jgi:hypothetical protein
MDNSISKGSFSIDIFGGGVVLPMSTEEIASSMLFPERLRFIYVSFPIYGFIWTRNLLISSLVCVRVGVLAVEGVCSGLPC